MTRSATRKPTKQAANLSVRADLLTQARKAGINLSAVLERALTQELARTRREQWIRDNEQAIEAYNEFIAKHGVPGDEWRNF
jgi:antitoxin CcdA